MNNVRFYSDGEIGEQFVYVPGGPFIVGADRHATRSWERQVMEVPDFFIGRFPIPNAHTQRRESPPSSPPPAQLGEAPGRWTWRTVLVR